MHLRRYRPHLIAWLLIVHLMLLAVLALRGAGLLQPLELVLSDQLSRRLPAAEVDSGRRITLIAVNEGDLRSYGWPLADGVLADAIRELLRHEPRAIGVDIYRDTPVAPGSDQLAELLRSHSQLYWINRFQARPGETAISPPAAIPTDQVGFNDLLLDPDGVVRRGLLFMDDGERFGYSFALRLALAWLEGDGITPRPDADKPEVLRLGLAAVPPLEADDGPYAQINAAGYQILLQSRARTPLRHFSLDELQQGALPATAIRDRVILIGSTATSTGDVFATPFHPDAAGADGLTHGLELHGRITGQLIAQALGEMPPLHPVGKVTETLWIWLWVALGGGAGLLIQGKARLLAGVAAGISLLTLATGAALWFAGSWLPLAAPGGGMLGAMILLAAQQTSWLRQRQRQIAQRNARLERENLRMQAELDVVRRLQTLLLPRERELNEIRGFEIAAHMAPASEVGGDYYDVIPHADGVYLAIGDATGHGLEAGALALMAQMGTRVLLANGETDPVRFFNAMNLALLQNTRRLDLDANLTYCLLDLRGDRILAAGQHESLLLVRPEGVEEVSTQPLGLWLGFMEEIAQFINLAEVPFAPGELLVVYSDGLTEATNADGEEFGLARLMAAIEGSHGLSPQAVRERALSALKAFVGQEGGIDDDVTLVVVRRKEGAM
jgi:CHASE2 domain-containing sensor protein